MQEDKTIDDGGLEQLLGFRLAQARMLPDSLFEHHVGRPTDLRPVEFCLLALAHANPGISPARLASALGISRPQATQCLDKLEGRQLAKRQRSTDDGRGFEVHATAAGARLVRDSLSKLRFAEREAIRTLTPAERAMLLELLGKLSNGKTQVP